MSASDSRAGAGWARFPLVALLAGVALTELALNRIAGHLLPLDPFASRSFWRRALSDTRLFAYELTAVLSVMMLGSALARIAAFGDRYRIGARMSFTLVGLVVVVLSALGAVAELPGDLFFHLHLSFAFLALLITMSIIASSAPARVRLGAVILYLPVALHFAARLTRRVSPVPELTSTPLELEAVAQAMLAAAAVVSIPCFASRRHGVRLGIGLAAALVGATAVLVRLDWETAARVAAYGFGIALPMAPWALIVYLLALGGFVFTVTTLLSSTGNERLRGWGLLFVGMSGLDQAAPFQMTLAALGLLCIAESVVRGAGVPMTREAFENILRRGAAAVGAPQVMLTGAAGYETVRLHSPPTSGVPVALSLSRHTGLISGIDIVVGEALPRDPPFTVERRDAGKLGPRADGPAIDTGDAAFDQTFATRDRRGLNAQLLDDNTRARLGALCNGWLGVWPQRGVHYRARSIAGGDDALPLLIELLRDSGVTRGVMLYLFDIDGTLIGGDGSGRRAFEQACHDHLGILGALEHLRLDGMTDPLILESVFRHHHDRAPTVEESRAIFDVYVGHLEREVAAGLYHVKPAVHETLDLLEGRDAVIGLATGNLEAGARIKLQRGDLWRRFAFGGFGSDAAERAEVVRTAIRRGVERAGRTFMRDEIWVIGDTPRDVAAAHAAGARAVAIATGWYTIDQLRESGAEIVHPTMAEWLDTL